MRIKILVARPQGEPPGSKFCLDCKEDRPISEFGGDKQSPDGYNRYCKKHANERSRKTYAKKKIETQYLVGASSPKSLFCREIEIAEAGINAAFRSLMVLSQQMNNKMTGRPTDYAEEEAYSRVILARNLAVKTEYWIKEAAEAIAISAIRNRQPPNKEKEK